MEADRAEELIARLKISRRLSREDVLAIIGQAESIFETEPTVINITGDVSVVGDLHGQYYDFLSMLTLITTPGILFLGDYVDRGYNSVELLLHLLLLKLLDREKVILLRGNHENRAQTAAYGFMRECVHKYDMIVYWRMCNLFYLLPLAAVVNGHYVCVHGGLSPGMTLGKLSMIDRACEYHPEAGDLLWGDPADDIEWFGGSPRGAGYLFGERAVESFLAGEGAKVLVRSHQLVMDGAKEEFGGACVTVWSAPNYCYKCRNIGAFMEINGISHRFIYFEAVEEQYREGNDPMEYMECCRVDENHCRQGAEEHPRM